MPRIRFPFAGNLNSHSGPDVLVGAITEAIRNDPRFVDLNKSPWQEGDITWYPVLSQALLADIHAGRQIAIGPNVLFADSQQPGAGEHERRLMAYENYAAVFTLSRWYSALQQRLFLQKRKHFVLDYPLPEQWLTRPVLKEQKQPGFVFFKGGPAEYAIVQHFVNLRALPVVQYGSYSRDQLFDQAGRSRVCFYVSREDHYPLAAVEIGLMGCPIISDERACPVIRHGVNGIICPVRERGEQERFAWTADAADRMLNEARGAESIPRDVVREATLTIHSAARFRDRVANILLGA